MKWLNKDEIETSIIYKPSFISYKVYSPASFVHDSVICESTPIQTSLIGFPNEEV